jgi:hypothetical protein
LETSSDSPKRADASCYTIQRQKPYFLKSLPTFARASMSSDAPQLHAGNLVSEPALSDTMPPFQWPVIAPPRTEEEYCEFFPRTLLARGGAWNKKRTSKRPTA